MTTTDVYPALIERHEAVYGYRYTGYWMDIGAPERYLQAHWDLLDGALGDVWLQRLPTGSHVVLHPDDMPPVAPGVILVPPVVLGPEVALAPDVCGALCCARDRVSAGLWSRGPRQRPVGGRAGGSGC